MKLELKDAQGRAKGKPRMGRQSCLRAFILREPWLSTKKAQGGQRGHSLDFFSLSSE